MNDGRSHDGSLSHGSLSIQKTAGFATSRTAALLGPRTSFLGAAKAQNPIIAIDPPSFQLKNGTSYQTELLDRLAISGEYSPDDLIPLARLVALQSQAMFAGVRYNLTIAVSPLQMQLESQVQTFWNPSSDLDNGLRSVGADTIGSLEPSSSFGDMSMAYGQLNSSLGRFPGASHRAAENLSEVSPLLVATGSSLTTIGVAVPDTEEAEPTAAFNAETFKVRTTIAANSLVALIVKVQAPDSVQPPRSDLVQRLNQMLDMLRELRRSLALDPSRSDVEQTMRAILRRTREIEPEIVRAGRSAGFERDWRAARDEIAAMAGTLGLPYVIDVGKRPAASVGPSRERDARAALGDQPARRATPKCAAISPGSSVNNPSTPNPTRCSAMPPSRWSLTV